MPYAKDQIWTFTLVYTHGIRLLQGYNVQQNFLVRFQDDEIDQSAKAGSWMLKRYVVCITIIDTIILTKSTNNAYIYDTYTSHGIGAARRAYSHWQVTTSVSQL
jgi:hypothetical protein